METRVLHLSLNNSHNCRDIFDSDRNTLLYTVYETASRPQLKVYTPESQGQPAQLVGEISYHALSSSINVSMAARKLEMHKAGRYGAKLTSDQGDWLWESTDVKTTELTDSSGNILASYDSDLLLFIVNPRQGSITLYGSPSEGRVDQIVVTALAMARRQRRGMSRRTGPNPMVMGMSCVDGSGILCT